MTIENETSLETSSTEDEDNSLEAAILGAVQELEGDDEPAEQEPKADEQLSGDEGEDRKQSPSDKASEAARILAKSRKRGKKEGAAEGAKTAPAAQQQQSGQERPQPQKVAPPTRWEVKNKEWFNQQPPEVQYEVSKAAREMEGQFTKVMQDLRRKESSIEGVVKTLDHYTPLWNRNGMTREAAVAELAGLYQLLHESPEQGIVALAQKTGVDLQRLAQAGGQPVAQPQQHQQQQNSLTRDDVLRIMQETQQHAQTQAFVQQGANEVLQVRNEVTADGRYLYPELWSPQYLDRVKPLVESQMRTQQGVSIAEATKRAVQVLRQLDGQGSSQPLSSAASTQSDVAKVKGASVSVRGRGNPAIPTTAKAKPGESLQESLEAAFAEATRH